MAYGLYDGFADWVVHVIFDVLSFVNLVGPGDFEGFKVEFQYLRLTLIDSLEMTTILGFLIISTIMLIWFERKLVGRMMNRRGPVFIDFNYVFD